MDTIEKVLNKAGGVDAVAQMIGELHLLEEQSLAAGTDAHQHLGEPSDYEHPSDSETSSQWLEGSDEEQALDGTDAGLFKKMKKKFKKFGKKVKKAHQESGQGCKPLQKEDLPRVY
jgi:hypothetical protein